MIRIYTIRGVLSMRNTRGCGTVSTCVNRHFSRHERFGRLGQESVRISIYNPKTPAYKRTIRRATTSDERKGRNYWRFHCSACRSAYKAKNQRSSFLPLTRKLRLVPALASLVKEYIGARKNGFLFETSRGLPMSPRNITRDSLHPILKEMGRESAGFHTFRRFRESILQMS